MAICPTKYHGDVEYSAEAALRFPRGLFGFEDETRFLALEIPSARPIVFLQSLTTAELCFLCLPVLVVEPKYRLALAEEDLKALGLPPGRQPRIGEEVFCLAIVTVQEGKATTANLMAPLVIRMDARLGAQALSIEPGYSHRQEFLAPRQEVLCS
jgi:flagellar assembly factor FliW